MSSSILNFTLIQMTWVSKGKNKNVIFLPEVFEKRQTKQFYLIQPYFPGKAEPTKADRQSNRIILWFNVILSTCPFVNYHFAKCHFVKHYNLVNHQLCHFMNPEWGFVKIFTFKSRFILWVTTQKVYTVTLTLTLRKILIVWKAEPSKADIQSNRIILWSNVILSTGPFVNYHFAKCHFVKHYNLVNHITTVPFHEPRMGICQNFYF
jgi:hypothetical protein